MAINLGPGKKRPVQKGRNFVWPTERSKKHAAEIQKVKTSFFDAKKKRSLARAKKFNREIGLSFIREKLGVGGKFDRQSFRLSATRRINAFLLKELSLKKSTRETLSLAFEYDANLYAMHNSLSYGENVSRKELIKILSLGLEEIGLLDKKTLGQNEVIKKNTKNIRQLVDLLKKTKSNLVKIEPTAIGVLKRVNDLLVKQLLGENYDFYKRLQGVVTENLAI